MAKKNKKSKKNKKCRDDDEIYKELLFIEMARMMLKVKLISLENKLGYDPEEITMIAQKEMLDALMSGKGGDKE